MTGTGRLALCATLLCGALGARAAEAPKRAAPPLCAGCLDLCVPPLSYADSFLDASTDSYLVEAARGVSRAAAIELAVRLGGIHRAHVEGHFGSAYAAHAAAIESLAAKPAEARASSAEIRSLKSVRTALYADAIVGLEAAAARSPSPGFRAAYAAREAVLERVIGSMASPQPMRAAERLAVCEVLAAYVGGR